MSAASSGPPRHPDTEAVHGAGFRDDGARAHVPPIHLSTVFEFAGVDEMRRTFTGERPAWIYGRYGNPTVDLVERHVAALEGAEAALGLASGMAAISTALLAILQAGDRILAAADLYGGTRNLFGILERLGIRTDYFPLESADRLAVDWPAGVRVLYVETPTNPTMKVVDLDSLACVAHAHGALVFVDSTFATPVLQRPLALGCDVVIHSATKALAGHDDVTAGFIAGSAEMIDRSREVMKWMGGCLDPHAAWLIERGLKTLALRVARQSENALAVARRLEQHPAVERVHYPGLASHPGHAVARRQMRAFGGLLAFDLRGGAAAVESMAARLRLVKLAPTLGGVETIYLVPAVSSHIRMTPEERAAVGIADGSVRVSCGIEAADDLIADFEQALA